MGRNVQPIVAVGQAGGPTAVMNASLYGFALEARKHCRLFGLADGFQGLAQNRFVEFDATLFRRLTEWRDAPGALLGSGRWPMTDESISLSLLHLKQRDIHHLVMIGGNGTMWTCRRLQEEARAMNYDLAILGIPKTVDNDLLETDHSPGFGSAARYVAASVRDIGADLYAMRNFEKIRIVETMGRNVGWLAASGMLLKEADDQPPHLVYVPERPFRMDTFMEQVTDAYDTFGYAMVVVSEGLRDEDGNILSRIALQKQDDRKVLGGVSAYLAEQVYSRLKLPVRAENLGMSQRCSSIAVSRQDRIEAEALGKAAAAGIVGGHGGDMLTLLCDFDNDAPGSASSAYAFRIGSTPLERVAGYERPLPNHYLLPDGTGITSAFKIWLSAIVGTDLKGYSYG